MSTPPCVTNPLVVDSTRSIPIDFAVLAFGIGAIALSPNITNGQRSPASIGPPASDKFKTPTSTAPATTCVASSPPPLKGIYLGIG